MLHPYHLECDNAENPIGVEKPAPTLGWILQSIDNSIGCKQIAFEIGVSSDLNKLSNDQFDLWKSGRIESSQMKVRYGGSKLPAGQLAHWKVRVWDQNNVVSAWSSPAHWASGLIESGDWKASWIGTSAPFGREHPLPIFRKEFAVQSKLKQAVIYYCGLGQVALHVNGSAVTDDVLEPAWSMYDKTVLYVGHDVTDWMIEGKNVLGFWIGQGMYNVLGGRYTKFKRSFGPHRLIAQLHLQYEDGATEIISTDSTWKTTAGPITFSCIYGGEDFDATKEQSDWQTAGFDDSSWTNAIPIDAPIGQLRAQQSPPIRVGKHYSQIKAVDLPDGKKMIDLGQNMSGWPTIDAAGPAGAKISVRPGELLDEEGRPSQKHTGSPVIYSYTLSGNGRQSWKPKFSYTGFRYLEVETPEGVSADFGGDFTHSAVERVGDFECSSDLLNRIRSLIDAAARSNLSHVLTDCPHREKLGWLEVVHLMQPSLMWNYDMRRFLTKVCIDMRDSQMADGCIPTIAPEYVTFKDKYAIFSNSPEWGCSSVLAPWQMYERYGDDAILADSFQMMQRYTDYLTSRASDGVIDFGLADWYDIGPGDHGYGKITSAKMTGTTVYYQCAKALAASARVIGKKNEADQYEALSAAIRDGFNRQLFNRQKGIYDSGSQCSCAMVLTTGLALPEYRQSVLDQLIADIRKNNNHITAGDIGFRYVVQALGEAGRADVIYDLLTPATPPGYVSILAAGATTLTEAWDACPKNSQNHLMLGHAEQWFWEELAGLKINLAQTAQSSISIAPKFIGDISWVRASHRSVVGEIKISWKRLENRVFIDLTIPPNQTARLQLPANKGLKINAAGNKLSTPALHRELADSGLDRVLESGRYDITLQF